jgi:hypothetical protein
VASSSPWKPISEDEILERRKHLDKGHTREQNTMHTVGYDSVESDGNDVSIPMPQQVATAAVPREVADEIYGMMWLWAKGSRENFALMAQMIRTQEPDSYGHLSDDELATKLETHAKDAARKAVEHAYGEEGSQWDRGNDLDMWEGKGYVLTGDKGVSGGNLSDTD